MKKYLFSALALPLLFACSTDDFEKPVASNDPYPGIEKVNATFYMDEGPVTRMDNGTGWTLAAGDMYGFAWMGNTDPGTEAGPKKVVIDGNAYQNHNLIQTNVPELGGDVFKPQTSIYVGKYYIYRPYDPTTVSPQAINFNSLKEQPMIEGMSKDGDGWKKLAEKAIIIGDKWTTITPEGKTYPNPETPNNPYSSVAGGDWDLPGIAKPYKVFAAFFSNQTGLDLTYKKNNPEFKADKNIKGATDIDYDIKAGDAAGAADIYGATVQLAGAANSFTYAPTESPNGDQHDGEYWANKTKATVAGFSFANGENFDVITLNAPVGEDKKVIPIGTGDDGSKGWFWFNSLPVTGGDAATAATLVNTKIRSSYGTVTINSTVGDCAYAFEKRNADATAKEWIDLGATASADPLVWVPGAHDTFVNQFGNHKGKYSFNVDFSTAVMDIHIVDDAHLQKYLKFYIASKKNQGANLVLDGDAENSFKLSKLSIALLQTINSEDNAGKVKVAPCKLHAHNAPEGDRVKIIITQDGQDDPKVDLADATEVPALNDVFATTAIFENDAEDVPAVPVYLSKDCTWTWDKIGEKVGDNYNGILPIDGQVASITNEGTLTVKNTNVQLSENSVAAVAANNTVDPPVAAVDHKYYLVNAAGATMDFTVVTTVKNDLTNLGTINIGDDDNTDAELRAYNAVVINDATDAIDLEKRGKIYNHGALGATDNTTGVVNNYGEIFMMNDDAITLLRSNELNEPAFNTPFDAATNKMGTVTLPANNPCAIVSVHNQAENGFIKWNWSGAVYTHDSRNVKYNTIVVTDNIEFREDADGNKATEIQYIEFRGERIQVVNPQNAATKLTNLKGIIVTEGSSIIIEKTNSLNCQISAYIGKGATVYKGGKFVYPATAPANNYFGTWSTDQVVVW